MSVCVCVRVHVQYLYIMMIERETDLVDLRI